jgi:nitroreductase
MASAFGSRSGWARAGGRDKAHLQTWSLALEPPTEPVELARALIAAAVLAPSDWNCQPWRFEVDGTIRIVADRRRGLPALDPTGRGMMISLGAALENLLVAARAYGLRPTVTYFPRGLADPVVAEVSWATGDARRDRGLFHSIPLRRTNRRVFDGRGIFPENRAQLAAQVPESYRMYWMDSEDDIRELAELGRAAAEARAQNDRMAAEQFEWTRFGDDDALKRGDGITVDALEYGGLSRWFSRRYLDPKSRMNRFGVEATGRRAHSCLRTAGAVALLVSEKAGVSAWLMGGQAYERVALKATQLGIAHQPINEAIDIPDLRAELLRRFGVASGEPLMLVRLGHAKRPDPAPRRSVAMVAAFKNT